MAENNPLKTDRNRFVKLAFCRADILFELDDDHRIVFCAGASEALFGKTPEQLVGNIFPDLVIPSLQSLVHALLNGSTTQRIEDAPLTLSGPGKLQLPAVIAGYHAPEFDNHTFLALKIVAPMPDQNEEIDPERILNQEEFSKEAAKQLKTLVNNGGEGQITLVRIKRLKDLFKEIGASDKQALTSAICDVLKRYSLGGNTAGQISEERFGYAHTHDVDPDKVNIEIEEAARPYLPDGEEIETGSLTLDADNAAMSEDQVAKALVHTMSQFCSADQKISALRLSDALDEMMTDTVETVKFIRQVTADNDFDLVYMPICDMRIGRVHHFEALSRFRDLEKAKSTFQIITLAENLGLIPDFDYAVFLKTLRQIENCLSQGSVIPGVAVNMSSISLQNEQFIQRVQNVLNDKPDLHKRILFEITESAEIKDLEKANKIIQSFRDKGFKFCLDDFGAGAASFDYLNAFEVDVVKFDGPVVRRACASKRGHDLLSTMTKMCSSAGIETVAEMVEDKKIANQVFYCGIDYGQGWYFGKPHADPLSFSEMFAGKE